MADAVARGVEGDQDVSHRARQHPGFGVPPSTLTPLMTCGSHHVIDRDVDRDAGLSPRRPRRLSWRSKPQARASASRIKILSSANLDMNGEGKQGLKWALASTDVPFNGNRVRRRARCRGLTQASARYLAVQATVRTELRSGVARLTRARQVLQIWDEQVIESLQIERQQAEKAYEAGETPLYTMLDTARRLVIARQARLDARVSLLTAAIALDRAIGRSCAFR